ncbi:MAG: MucB/RseB C-terminal domain-containing protein [Gammaproteobacteria bacterium]
MLGRHLVALVLLAGAEILPAQEPDATALVERMAQATEQLSYDGTFVYQRGAQIDTMRIVHRYDDGVERERLISLSGPEREVIRDGERVTCLFADDREAMVEKSEPRDFLSLGLDAPIENLVRNYTFTIAGKDRVAGRATTVINIVPREPSRYGYQLWVDVEHGLLLKSLILNRAGQALEQVQFVTVDIGEQVSAAALETQIVGSGFTWHTSAEPENSAAEVVETSGWSVNWLPAGFQMRNFKVQTMSESDMPISHMVYSDGLAMVSVFVEKLTATTEPMQGYSSMGAVNAFSRVAQGHQITVVGEIPLPTVRQIASSVAHQ